MREIAVHSVAEEHTVHQALTKIAEVDACRLRDQHHHMEEKMASLMWSEEDSFQKERGKFGSIRRWNFC